MDRAACQLGWIRPGWTDARVETLKSLWLRGVSCSQIAEALGGVTRSAVIGKVSRLGLSGDGRVKPSAPSREKAFRAVRPAREPRAAPAPALRPLLAAEGEGGAIWPTPETARILTDLTKSCCRFPVGAANGAEQLFCGAARPGEGPYCAGHAAVVIGKPPSKRKAS